MMGLIPIVILGCLVLAFGARIVLQSWRDNRRREVTIHDYTCATEALDACLLEGLTIKKIMSAEDLAFIRTSGTPHVQRFFKRERKKLAIQWLRRTQTQVAQLMDLHLRLAGCTSAPDPEFELELSLQYLAFLLVTNAVLAVTWAAGPFEASRLMRLVVEASGHFWIIFRARLGTVDPSRLIPG